MAKRDIFHDAVKHALQKEAWQITHDPLSFKIEDISIQIDLAAERLITAEKGNEKIAVEVKSFVSGSAISDFHTALGQFINYRDLLKIEQPERVLFLAVPTDTYEEFFTINFVRDSLIRYQVRLIAYDPKLEEITLWQP